MVVDPLWFVAARISAVLSIQLTRLKPRGPPKARAHAKAGR